MMHSYQHKSVSILWSVLWFMLPISMRGTVLALWLFGLAVLLRVILHGPGKMKRIQLITTALFVLFFVWQGFSLILDNDHNNWVKALEKKSSFVVIPLLIIVLDQKKFALEKWAIRGFFSGLFLAGITMLAVAVWRSLSFNDLSPWFYHELASPFKIGAIYFSWYFSAAIIYLVFRQPEKALKKLRTILLLFFILMLLLLASKLFILMTGLAILPRIFHQRFYLKIRPLIRIILLTSIIALSIPFVLRIAELRNTDLSVLKQDTFSYDTPFNGLTFRMLQWRFAKEILDEKNGWFTGVGLNSTQATLDAHYKEKGVYTGNPDLGDHGYLGYNFHNQYLETLVSTGAIGLIILLLIILVIFKWSRNKLLFPLPVIIITALFFFSESVLERQAGIIFFCLFVFTFTEQVLSSNGNRSINTGRE